MSFIHDTDVAHMYQHVVGLPQGFGKTRLAMSNMTSSLDKKLTWIVHSSAKHLAPADAQVIIMDRMPVMPKLPPRSISPFRAFEMLLQRQCNFEECQRLFSPTPVESRVSLFVKSQMGIVPNVPFSE